MSALFALLLCFAGLLILRLGWRRADAPGRLATPLGWALLISAGGLSVQLWGAEFGISYWFAAFTLVALLFVAANSERRPVIAENGRSSIIGVATQRASARQKWLTFLAAGPLAGLASCQLTLLVAYVLPGNEVNNMAIAAITFPVLWGMLAYVVCAIAGPGTWALALSTAAAIFSIVLYA